MQSMALLLFCAILIAIVLFTWQHWTLKPKTSLQAYLLFTVVFYSYRWIFQWGTPSTTLYDMDAPFYVRLLKDVALVSFIMYAAAKNQMQISALAWYLSPFIAWYVIAGFVKLLTLTDSHQVLFWFRQSIEYMPLAFLCYNERLHEFIRFVTGLCWIVVGFTGVEVFSGRTSGFAKGGLDTRFGSIFGSPNDFGLFSGLILIGLLIFPDLIPTVTRYTLTMAFAVSLVITGSRSAIVGFAVALCVLWPRSKRWLLAMAASGVLVFVILATMFQDADLASKFITRATDSSAMERVNQYSEIKAELLDWGPSSYVLGSSSTVFTEDFYASVLLRSGYVGLTLLTIALVGTFRHLRHPFLRSAFVLIGVASLFVPFFETFPSSAYLWLVIGAGWKLSEEQSQRLRPLPASVGVV